MSGALSLKDCMNAVITNDKPIWTKAVVSLIQIIDNVLFNFDDPKNARLYLSSDVMMSSVLPTLGAMELLVWMGFEEKEDQFVLRDLSRVHRLVSCKRELLRLKDSVHRGLNSSSGEERSLGLELESQLQQMEFFEIPELQRRAKELIPLEELNSKALLKYNVLKSQDSVVDLQDCLIVELLSWFKEDFFRWFQSGYCDSCQQNMTCKTVVDCNYEEDEALGIRTELHICTKCSKEERFPRYFYPGALLQTRKGRCMEWSSCFMLMCRSLGYDTRYILDKTDHVWNEIYFHSQQRWVHADPCENKIDSPLMYELGWNKKLAYVFAFSKDEVLDCVWKYSSNHAELVKRRTKYDERNLAYIIQSLNDEKRNHFTEEQKKMIHERRIKEIVSFFKPPSTDGDYESRSSGSLAWRLSRGETSISTCDTDFTFKPSINEVKAKEMTIKYSAVRDIYEAQGVETKRWQSCVSTSKNIFRKDEKDWKNFYLARTEGSNEGSISWNISWSGTGLKLKSIFVHFSHATFENGLVSWKVYSTDWNVQGERSGKMELTTKDWNKDFESFKIDCDLSGGKGDVAWQHAQLFRQNETEKNSYPFVVTLKFQ